MLQQLWMEPSLNTFYHTPRCGIMLKCLSRITRKCRLLITLHFYKIIIFTCLKKWAQVYFLFLFFVSCYCLFFFFFFFCFQHKKGIKNFYFIALGQGNPTTSIDSAAANRIDSASVIRLTKQSAGSEKKFCYLACC